jgi:ABC-type Fe3+ transport system substrate-binding protein
VYSSASAASQAVVSGEAEWAFGAGYGTYMRLKQSGAPVGFSILQDGTFYMPYGYGMLADNPTPGTAALLVSWLLTDEGQASIVKHVNEFGVMPNAPAPEGTDSLPDHERFSVSTLDQYTKDLEHFADVFKQ